MYAAFDCRRVHHLGVILLVGLGLVLTQSPAAGRDAANPYADLGPVAWAKRICVDADLASKVGELDSLDRLIAERAARDGRRAAGEVKRLAQRRDDLRRSYEFQAREVRRRASELNQVSDKQMRTALSFLERAIEALTAWYRMTPEERAGEYANVVTLPPARFKDALEGWSQKSRVRERIDNQEIESLARQTPRSEGLFISKAELKEGEAKLEKARRNAANENTALGKARACVADKRTSLSTPPTDVPDGPGVLKPLRKFAGQAAFVEWKVTTFPTQEPHRRFSKWWGNSGYAHADAVSNADRQIQNVIQEIANSDREGGKAHTVEIWYKILRSGVILDTRTVQEHIRERDR